MTNFFTTRKGAITLSIITLLTEMWRGFLDAMFVFPTDFGGNLTFMHAGALIFTLLFAGWAWSLVSAARGSRGGLIAAFSINALVLVAIPISWLFVYCPEACRVEAGIFNLANTLNLVFGILSAFTLGLQFRQKNQVRATPLHAPQG
jgi:hypothetical protein